MRRQVFLKCWIVVCVLTYVLFANNYVALANSSATMVAQFGEVTVNPARDVEYGETPLYQNDKVTVKNGLAVIAYHHLVKRCPEVTGVVILPAGKRHTVQSKIDADCDPTDERDMSKAFALAKQGTEMKITLYAGGKSDEFCTTCNMEQFYRLLSTMVR
ncbi:MAG: hypothetical protein D3923_14595 [Candidatus Electrothrix sp. AR3]|nr:hypothetical protein [Candidatus Electrothrix sp. AR3]